MPHSFPILRNLLVSKEESQASPVEPIGTFASLDDESASSTLSMAPQVGPNSSLSSVGSSPHSYHSFVRVDNSPDPLVLRGEATMQAPSKRMAKTIILAAVGGLLLLAVFVVRARQSTSAAASLVETASLTTDTTSVMMAPSSPISTSISDSDLFKWSNTPKYYNVDKLQNKLQISVPPKTDYWRITYQGFIKDNGPFYYRIVDGDFEATAKFSADYTNFYDQAGILVRESQVIWLKAGVEYTDNVQHASTVVTRGFSDWSISPIAENPESIWFRVKRTKETIEVFYSGDGENFVQTRQGYLTQKSTLEVGLFAAAPADSNGFDVIFEDFTIVQS